MIVLGLHGCAGSGKTTLADALVKLGWTKVSFAYPLKKIVVELFDVTMEQLTDPDLKTVLDTRYNMTPRKLMQVFATECIRDQIQSDFWVKKMKTYLHELDAKGVSHVVIDDVRFVDEAQLIRSMVTGSVCRLSRLGCGYTDHISEQPLITNTDDSYCHNLGSIRGWQEAAKHIDNGGFIGAVILPDNYTGVVLNT